jgi:hypothetical protein
VAKSDPCRIVIAVIVFWMRCGPKECDQKRELQVEKGGEGREQGMNGELEVRESSLSYVIGSMNNSWTRKSEANDPCGQVDGR